MKRVITILLTSTMVFANLMPVLAADTALEDSVLVDVEQDGIEEELSVEPEDVIEENITLEADEETAETNMEEVKNVDDEINDDNDLPEFIKNSSPDPGGIGEEINDGTYKGTVNSDGTVTITGFADGAGDDIDPQIPATIGGKKVTAIGDGAFYNTGRFSGILVLPNTLKTIGDWAFYDYYGLKGDLVIPDSVLSIGEKAFYSIDFEGKLSLGKGIKSIGNSAFAECGFTGDLNIPNSVETIGEYAFSDCCFNERLKIGTGVRKIGGHAFSSSWQSVYNCFKGDLIIPNSVVTIEEYAFSSCGITGKLKIGNSVKEIGEGAFTSNFFKGDLIIPDSVVTIGDKAFEDGGFKNKLKIGKKVKSIGEYAFSSYSITEECNNSFKGDLIIPNSVKIIGKRAFSDSGFTGKLKISKKIKSIEESTFYNCGFVSDLDIPNGVETIGKEAFRECRFSGTLTIPKSVTDINDNNWGVSSFYNCYWVRKIKNNSSLSIKASNFIYGGLEDYFVNNKGEIIRGNGKIKKGTYTRNYIKVTGVNLNTVQENRLVGEKIKLIAKLEPVNATNQKLTWKSSNPKVASVSKNGMVTAKKAGKATITVTTKEGKKTAKCKVTVKNYVKVKGVKLNNRTAFLTVGHELTLEATINPKNATNKDVTWTSSDPGIVEVSEKGVIKGVTSGTATITVTTKDGGKTAECKVTVK